MIAAPRGSRRNVAGSAMVEVLVAVLLFAIGIVALVRLLGTAVKDTGEIEYRSQAVTLADERIGLMWVDRGNLAAYVEDAVALPELPGGTRTVEVNGDVVTVTIGWQAPGGPPRTHVVSATLASN